MYYLKYNWMEKGTEMQDLAKAAGLEVVEELSFRKIHKDNYITDSKFAELEFLVEENKIEYILFNEPISVRFMRVFEKFFNNEELFILDKTMLILDIFEKKASSNEIQLQIRLAKIKYTEPRMRQELGVAVHTEKQARERGSGETLKDIMKSDLRKRVSKLETKLEELRVLRRKNTSLVMKIPIMGFYSAGKTTVFNILTSSDRETSQDAFTTMFLKSAWTRVAGFPLEIVDTIGLVDLPPAVVDALSLMLESLFAAEVLVLTVDASLEENQSKIQLEALMEYYNKFAQENGAYKVIFMLTKCDLIDELKYNALNKLIEGIVEENQLLEVYEVIGIRSDRPKLLIKTFVETLELLLEDKLVVFEFDNLSPADVSVIHNHARVNEEKWEDGLATIEGIIPENSFEINLGYLTKRDNELN